jgi:hypothetical protein
VSQASLVGAIPESAINDSYVKKSQYFGPISINSDSTSGFDIRTFIKQSHSIVDAFWLEKPSRLIVDVFTKSSDRAQGPNMVLKRATASVASKNPTAIESGKVEPEGSKAMPSSVDWTKSEKPGDEAVLCFPANTQVKANIGFEKSAEAPVVPANIDNTYAKTASNGQDMIVCYPKGAQVTPHLKFQPSDTPFYGRAETDGKNNSNRNPSSSIPFYSGAPGNFQQPPMMGYPGQNFYVPPFRQAPGANFGGRDQRMNNEADLALSLPDDSGRMGYQESFSQKAPPMSLGKRLPPPGQR